MKYQRQNTTTGAWVKGSELVGVKKAIIISETLPQPSQFKDKNGNPKNQDVCKVKLDAQEEALNMALNRATISGLVDAFGEDSNDWINQPLKVETEKVRVGGVARIAVYLIPKGYEKVDNEEGYAEIRRMGLVKQLKETDDIPVINEDEEINVKDIAF